MVNNVTEIGLEEFNFIAHRTRRIYDECYIGFCFRVPDFIIDHNVDIKFFVTHSGELYRFLYPVTIDLQ